MKATIYHNPRCSKSRETLELLRQHQADVQIVEYLHTPPDQKTLRHLLAQLGARPRDVMRRNEDEYRELNLDDAALTDEQLIDASVAHPRLLERPIVVVGNKAVIGRPPARVLEIL